jgi:hypothetical protein
LIYNGYSRDLLKADFITNVFGYRVATKADLTTLLTYTPAQLKSDKRWLVPGTNETGLGIVGSSNRSLAGVFGTIKTSASFWCGDTDEVLEIGSTHGFRAAVKTEGHSIILVKE